MASTTRPRKGTRKWHPRTFSGCQQCRRRHVRCDETPGHCSNCARLNLVCGGYVRKIEFRIVGRPRAESRISPSPSPLPSPSPPSPRRRTPSLAIWPSTALESQHDEHEYNLAIDTPVLASADVASCPPGAVAEAHHTCSPFPALSCFETRYYAHFLSTVSSLLIVYDCPHNSNPYRLSFPQFAQSFLPLAEAMKALGALHLANTSSGIDRLEHSQAAMAKYGAVAVDLRHTLENNSSQPWLAVLATSLLLCLFEMMESRDASWKVHLDGSRHIYGRIVSPRFSNADEDAIDNAAVEVAHPMRRFLISLMAYLDVAGACATGEGTLIAGDYWEKSGGGWEYNLGAPSYSPARVASDRTMAQIRLSWSRIMSIQADISAFAKLKRGGMDKRQLDMIRDDLMGRITSWRSSAPDIFDRLANIDKIAKGAEDYDIFTAAAVVEAYEKASVVYLYRVASGRLSNTLPQVTGAVNRVLVLVKNFSRGAEQLGMLWALYTVGAETPQPAQQAFVKERLTEMKRFGFKHVSKALETLEYVWLQKRVFGEANWVDMEMLQSLILLP